MQTFQERYWPFYVEDYHRICRSQQRARQIHMSERYADLMESRKSHIRSLFESSPDALKTFDLIDEEFKE